MKDVSNENQILLREKGLIGEQEIAHIQGDLLVVVDVITQARRVLGPVTKFLNESIDRRILKG